MKKPVIIIGFVAFFLVLFVVSLLKTGYTELEEMLSHVQLLAVKIGSTIAVIMVITQLLIREFQHLFLENNKKQPSDEHRGVNQASRSFTENTSLKT